MGDKELQTISQGIKNLISLKALALEFETVNLLLIEIYPEYSTLETSQKQDSQVQLML